MTTQSNGIQKKYELIQPKCENGLYRIRALRDFGRVERGQLGGYVQSENNLSHEGESWIAEGAQAKDNAIVREDALLGGNAVMSGSSELSGRVVVSGWVEITGDAKISGDAFLFCVPDYEIDPAKLANRLRPPPPAP